MSRAFEELINWQKKERPQQVKKLSIIFTPPIFVLTVLSPSLLFYKRVDNFLGFSNILNPPLNLYIGFAIFTIGIALYVWTILLFARIGDGTQTPLVPTRKVVIRGPYSYSRNPMVSGVTLFIVGLGFIFNSYAFIFLGLIIPLVYLVFIKLVEEKELEARFGKEYIEYKKRVPFLIPKFSKNRSNVV